MIGTWKSWMDTWIIDAKLAHPQTFFIMGRYGYYSSCLQAAFGLHWSLWHIWLEAHVNFHDFVHLYCGLEDFFTIWPAKDGKQRLTLRWNPTRMALLRSSTPPAAKDQDIPRLIWNGKICRPTQNGAPSNREKSLKRCELRFLLPDFKFLVAKNR